MKAAVACLYSAPLSGTRNLKYGPPTYLTVGAQSKGIPNGPVNLRLMNAGL